MNSAYILPTAIGRKTFNVGNIVILRYAGINNAYLFYNNISIFWFSNANILKF